MEIKDTLKIAEEFSDTTGARDYEDGDYSGKEFYDNFLLPRFEQAAKNSYALLIDIDGVWGWPSSFVSGSFGLLSQEKGVQKVLTHLKFKCDSNPMKIEKAKYIIKNPIKK